MHGRKSVLTSGFNTFTFWEGLRLDGIQSTWACPGIVSTPLPSGKVCDNSCQPAVVKNCGVSTPLPSGKVCDLLILTVVDHCIQGFNTFTFWEGLRQWEQKASAPINWDVSTPLPSGKVCDLNI